MIFFLNARKWTILSLNTPCYKILMQLVIVMCEENGSFSENSVKYYYLSTIFIKSAGKKRLLLSPNTLNCDKCTKISTIVGENAFSIFFFFSVLN